MTGTTTSGATQAVTSDDTSTQAVTQTTSQPQAGEEPISLDEAKKLRSEAQSLRKRLKIFEDQQAEAEDAKRTDQERLQKQYEQAEQRIQKQNKELVNLQVKLAAKDKGIIDPEIAVLALDGKLEFGEDGLPSNLEKALDDLIKNKPYLVPKSGESAPASAAQSAPNVPAMNPGRSHIAQPGTLPTGQTLTWNDFYSSKRR